MVRTCCICRDTKLYSACLHQFPMNEERLAVWKQFCKLPQNKSAEPKRLCSVHFSNEYFINPTYKERGLRPNAVPTLYRNGILGSPIELEPEESYNNDGFDILMPEDDELPYESTSKMIEDPLVPRKTVPPLRIKNVRSLQTVHISDEDSRLSVDTASTSDNDNLIIDDMEQALAAKGEFYVINAEEATGGAHSTHRSRKRSRKPKPSSVDEDPMLFVDGHTIKNDEYEQDQHSSFRLSSNRHSINSDESLTSSRIPNASSHSSKGSRRKSHHVPKQVGDVVFEEATILTVEDDEDDVHGVANDDNNKEDVRNEPNRNLMKNIAMLRTCINYALSLQNCRPMPFKHNFESTSSMIEYYNLLKSNKK